VSGWKRRLVVRWTPVIGSAYLRFVYATSRTRVEGESCEAPLRAQSGNVLWALWHNRLLGPFGYHRNRSVGTVVSQSEDGEILAGALSRFGFVPLRGSSSRGGAKALIGVMRHVRAGFDVVITPDGPKGGPTGKRYEVAPGIIYAAQRTAFPIIPVGAGYSRKIVFRSWDRFQLPLPFGTIQIVYGEPLRVAEGDDAEEAARELARRLTAATERADALLGVSSL
jgi:lysophospholipid acyltransferase (LPLAT)-like uncharacterized protein